MNKYNFILVFLISICIGFSVSITFSQKTGRRSKAKMITLPTLTPKPPPKQLSIEVTVNGGGTFECDRGLTCVWSVDRKYSGTVILDEFIKVPFNPMISETGTATSIAQAKIDANGRTNSAAAYNSKWFTNSYGIQGMWFDVNVSINDQYKVSWLHKEKKDNQDKSEIRTITQTWTTNKTGKGVRYIEVVLDRQIQAFKVLFTLDSDAKMTHSKIRSWEEINELPEEEPVYRVPFVEKYLQGEVILPMSGERLDDKTASFEKTFSGLKSNEPCVGEIPATKDCTITVTYRFR